VWPKQLFSIIIKCCISAGTESKSWWWFTTSKFFTPCFFILLSLFWKIKLGLWDHHAVSVSVSPPNTWKLPVVARQWLSKHMPMAMNTYIGRIIFYAVRVISKESRLLVVPRTACFLCKFSEEPSEFTLHYLVSLWLKVGGPDIWYASHSQPLDQAQVSGYLLAYTNWRDWNCIVKLQLSVPSKEWVWHPHLTKL
jgi:hypothetical protein